MIKGGNTVWWGDLSSKAVKVGGGILSFGRTQTTGYKYFLGCQFMLCHGPVDVLVDVQADVKSVPRTTAIVNNGDGSENYIEITAKGDNLFGGTGPGGAGGISGIINFYRGVQTQQPDDYLTAKQGRVVLDQSGIGSAFHGTGNGTITSLSAGSSSLDETFTITAIGIDTNPLHSTFNKMKFTVVGSRSGSLSNSVANSDGSTACWADQAFGNSRINLTISTGSTQFANGDFFTVITEHATVAAAYRGLCYAVFKQLYVGTSNYPKPMAFVVRRCPDPLGQGSGVANISGDANPALVVYDLLNSIDYGLGIPAVRIDPTSFSAAASTLASEGLGVSMQFDTQASADQLIGEVLRHCDGLLYSDPATGLWTIVLARGGYDPTTLPVLTVDNVLATPDFSRGSWSETTNLVNIRYSSRAANFDDRSMRAYDPANISVTGEVRPQTIDFKGLSSETAAALVAIRVLKTLTYPLSKVKLVTNRTAWKFRPGGLFRFTWVPLGIVNQVFRITRIAYGELTDGKITMDAVEDIFGISSAAFVAPPSSGWVNPAGAPLPNSHEKILETPIDILVTEEMPAGINVLAICVRDPSVGASQYEIWPDVGGGFYDSNTSGNFAPYGVLADDYPAATVANDPTGFKLSATGGIDLHLLEAILPATLLNASQLAMIDDEIVAWQTPTLNGDGTISISNVLRGLFDTVPADHTTGAPVYFFSGACAFLNQVAFTTDRTVSGKFLPMNSFGTLPLASASSNTITTASRFADPYPPGNVRVQGQPYGTRLKTIVGTLSVTFSTRAREQAGQRPVTLQDAGDIIPQIGTFVEYIASVSGGISSLGGVITSPLLITGADRLALGGGHNPLMIELWAGIVIGMTTFLSPQHQRASVIFTGFGFTFGEYFGGLNS